MSYIEFVGTIFCLWSVWLISKRNILTWPVGIISVILYIALFYQIRLYSDTLEQVYYLGASIYGWWYWAKTPRETESLSGVRFSSLPGILLVAGITVVLSAGLGAFISRVHLILPSIFPEAASFPYLDALTTVMSLVAMWIMVRKKVESWVYWIIVDIIGIGLYATKNVRFVALLYIILLILAARGLRLWVRAASTSKAAELTQKTDADTSS